MDRDRFEQLVAQAIDGLPAEFRNRLDNVDVVLADQPTSAQLAESGLERDETLLGLYEGVPLTERGRSYGMVLPDKITIFQKPIEAECGYDAKIVTEIRKVVRHEIAHHFGISDARLEQLEKDED